MPLASIQVLFNMMKLAARDHFDWGLLAPEGDFPRGDATQSRAKEGGRRFQVRDALMPVLQMWGVASVQAMPHH
jgi:hypothetical protein